MVEHVGLPWVYDAFGYRVEENLGSGVTDWVYGPSDHPIWGFTAANQNSGGVRSEVYAGNAHLATYANSRTFFEYSDGLGSVRTHTSTVPLSPNDLCINLPFGDGLSCAGTSPDSLHFTGQVLDPHRKPVGNPWKPVDRRDVHRFSLTRQ
jgi:hypothetical protein